MNHGSTLARRRAASIFRSICAVALLVSGTAAAQPAPDPTQYTEQDRQRLLPSPILDDQPAWLTLYWKAWALAQQNIMKGTPQNGFVPYYLTSAFPGTSLFAWDTEFCSMFGKYGNGAMPGIVSLDNWYQSQLPDGGICRILDQTDGSVGHPGWTPTDPETCAKQAMNPPIYAWAEWQNYLVSGDASRFSKVIAGRTVLGARLGRRVPPPTRCLRSGLVNLSSSCSQTGFEFAILVRVAVRRHAGVHDRAPRRAAAQPSASRCDPCTRHAPPKARALRDANA